MAMSADANAPSSPRRAPIVVRRPTFDLSVAAGSERAPAYWWGGDPFKTHFLNALSSTFPFGEAFFVRSVKHYSERVADPRLLEEIRQFAGQEGQHSRLHDDHVDLLIEYGYAALATRNRLIDRIMRWHNKKTPRFSLAVTAALEHLTAMLARQVLENRGGWIDDMEPEMARFWRWHALEEAEHKAVAFEVMEAAEIPRWIRVGAMALNTFGLALETVERMAYMFWKDGRLFDATAWISGWRFLLGRGGFLRGIGADYRAWYRRDFHPDQIDDREMIERCAPLVAANG